MCKGQPSLQSEFQDRTVRVTQRNPVSKNREREREERARNTSQIKIGRLKFMRQDSSLFMQKFISPQNLSTSTFCSYCVQKSKLLKQLWLLERRACATAMSISPYTMMSPLRYLKVFINSWENAYIPTISVFWRLMQQESMNSLDYLEGTCLTKA